MKNSKKKIPFNPITDSFFRAEKAFYNGNYELALKYYLQAKGIQHFHFFCYRTSAFVSEKLEDFQKSETFAKKALSFFPNDLITLQFLQRLSSRDQVIPKQQQEYDLEKTHSIALGTEELNELASIFQEHDTEGSLFQGEREGLCVNESPKVSHDLLKNRRLLSNREK